jgi:hypothetical protein
MLSADIVRSIPGLVRAATFFCSVFLAGLKRKPSDAMTPMMQ